MRFWAAAVVWFYISLELFNWLTGLHWLANFSLPLAIGGGIGLAIASSASSLAIAAKPLTPDDPSPDTPENPIDSPQPAAPPAARSESSISFTINKPVRPQ